MNVHWCRNSDRFLTIFTFGIRYLYWTAGSSLPWVCWGSTRCPPALSPSVVELVAVWLALLFAESPSRTWQLPGCLLPVSKVIRLKTRLWINWKSRNRKTKVNFLDCLSKTLKRIRFFRKFERSFYSINKTFFLPLNILFCWLVRGSLFIELGCTRDVGKGWRGDLGTFMISRSI